MKLNTAEVAALQPEYLGFIFYKKSPRYFSGTLPAIAAGIKKVGVFVNASVEEISEKTQHYQLDVIQLHGEESPAFCKAVKNSLENISFKNPPKIWKVFAVKDQLDFSILADFEAVADAFLFDTKGEEKGGNGYTFNWNILEKYPSKIPIILSGGIGLKEVAAVKELLNIRLPIQVIDVNSKFETVPGNKNIAALKEMQKLLSNKI